MLNLEKDILILIMELLLSKVNKTPYKLKQN